MGEGTDRGKNNELGREVLRSSSDQGARVISRHPSSQTSGAAQDGVKAAGEDARGSSGVMVGVDQTVEEFWYPPHGSVQVVGRRNLTVYNRWTRRKEKLDTILKRSTRRKKIDTISKEGETYIPSISVQLVGRRNLTPSISVQLEGRRNLIHSISVQVVGRTNVIHYISVQVVGRTNLIHSISIQVVGRRNLPQTISNGKSKLAVPGD